MQQPIRSIVVLIFIASLAPALRAADDLSQPRLAARAFTSALGRGDSEAAKAAATGERQDMQFVDAVVAVALSRDRLNAAADAAFGPATQPISGIGPSLIRGAPDNAVLRIEGDTATLMAENGVATMRLRKIDAEWRVDLKATRGRRKDMKSTITRMELLTVALDAITECIKAGAYGNRDEAQRGLVRLIELANAGAPPTTQPAVEESTRTAAAEAK